VDLERLKENFNRGCMNIDDIKLLIDKVEGLEIEKEVLFEQNKKFRRRVFELREKTGFEVWQENLRLVSENIKLKEELDKLAGAHT